MKRWMKTFGQYKFLAYLNFYSRALWPAAHLAFEMYRSQILITETKDAMKEMLDSLEELEGLDVD